MMIRTFARCITSYAVIKPYINVDITLREIDYFKENALRRKLDINLDELVVYYEKLKQLTDASLRMENMRESLTNDLRQLDSEKDTDNQKKRLITLAKVLRNDYKQLKSSLSEMEQNMIHLMLRVPNVLHPATLDKDHVAQCSELPAKSNESHLEIGAKLDLLEYRSPSCYFLKNEAAQFELNSMSNLTEMLKNGEYVGFSNPDFSREIILDACHGVYSQSIPLKKFDDDQDVHYITGGVSLLPFLAFFTKKSTAAKNLPFRCFCSGRHYSPASDSNFGLFQVNQTNAIQIFTLSNPRCGDAELDSAVSLITKYYNSLGVPCRVVVKKASDLCVSESLRVSFEVYSPYFEQFFESGHISFYGSKISKIMNIHITDGESGFPCIISGTVAQATSLIACVLENKKCL